MVEKSYSESYAAAGVDITAGYRAVELMKKHVARTRNEGCLDDVGGFGGCFGLPIAGMEEPVLVSGTDGCGTKVKLAILMDKHDTIGIDAVAMCVNDIICVGAKPLFFLDYIACGKNIPEKIAEIVGGVAEGCVQSGAALIGGETAEHPGLMPVEDYDLAGFAVGIVDKKKIIDNTRMAEGDVVLALPSTGIHSNGFSLCRKVFNIDNNDPLLYIPRDELKGKTIDFMSINAEFVGYRYTGTIDYRPNTAEADIHKATVTITPMSASSEPILNARPQILESLSFANSVPATVKVGEKFSLAVRQSNAIVSVSVKKIADDTNAETDATANANTTDVSAVTISAEGLYAFTVSASGFAPWTTTVYAEATP